jgi:hypothetical protein
VTIADLTSLGAVLAFGLIYCEIAAQLAGVYQRRHGRIHTSELIGIVTLWLPIAVVALFRALFHVIRRGG